MVVQRVEQKEKDASPFFILIYSIARTFGIKNHTRHAIIKAADALKTAASASPACSAMVPRRSAPSGIDPIKIMVYKPITRPLSESGTMDCIVALEKFTTNIIDAPTNTIRSSESGSQ